MKKIDMILCLLLIIVGIVIIVLSIKYIGIVATILVLVALIGTVIMNERHNPKNLYFKNSGKIHKKR